MNEWNYFDSVPQYHPILDADNLYEAFKMARKGSHWKTQVQRFRWNVGTEIYRLQQELGNLLDGKSGAYALSDYSKFIVNERGKTRAITALSIRDRVVKHCLNDVFLIPHIRPHLIYDNGASLKDKGISFSRNRIVSHLEKYYKENGTNNGYIMTMDFSGYYDNIDHKRSKEVVRKYESDPFAIYLTDQAIDSYRIDVSYMNDEEYEVAQKSKFNMVEYRKYHLYENRGEKYLNKSLSVGDQTSQIIAITFPTPIDNLVKIVLGKHYYGRYMDDLYVIAQTVEELLYVKTFIGQMAKYLMIIINPRKTKIYKLSQTFTFLQYKYYLTENGHVVVRINPKTITRIRKKLKKLKKLLDENNVKKNKIEEMFRSWIGNYISVMSNKQVFGLISLYRQLFGDGLDKWFQKRKILEGDDILAKRTNP